jgi:hypothetical protein
MRNGSQTRTSLGRWKRIGFGAGIKNKKEISMRTDLKKVVRVAQSKILKEFFADRFIITELEEAEINRFLTIKIGDYRYRAIVFDNNRTAMLLSSIAFDSPINIDDRNDRPRLKRAFYRVLAGRIGKRNV